MRYRRLGKTGYKVSEIGFGSWAIGGDWGATDDEAAMTTLHAAVDAGVTFFDTADVYGDGHSERLLGRLRRERDDELVVATKVGRRGALDPDVYTYDTLRDWMERSRDNLEVDRLDLVQLHCPPTDTYYRPDVFESLAELVDDGVTAAVGVSVERVEEGLKAIEYDAVSSVQIIFNVFRQRPVELFLGRAHEHDVGVIARVPLASGLLTGKYDAEATFDEDDHRNFNADGSAFDVGETFAGVGLERGVSAAEQLRARVPEGATLAQFALRWILMHPEVSTVIPGARTAEQARDNAGASSLAALSEDDMAAVAWMYTERIAPAVHHRW
ncbi:MAG: aldo/keto reductase [Actinobacteria bacterium]|nr:aldo/keto reductase [Actinomycetota bacterium]